jgi:GrpB-like predicted nucleotidyltransferase (UPF0157 family)
MDPGLAARLRGIGVDPDDAGDPADVWWRLFEHFGRRATLVDRYQLEAHRRGIEVAQLDPELRSRLAAEVLAVQFPGIEILGATSRTPVEVVLYDEKWPKTFEAWRRRLAAALGPAAIRIEHVGSTAVPGLAAKPVVDMQVIVADIDDEASYVQAIESTGVPLRSRDDWHRYFRPPSGQPRVVQIHVCDAGGTWERDHIVFRDHLRAHPEVAAAYGRLKLELAAKWRDDRYAYTDAKTAFILDVLEGARGRKD